MADWELLHRAFQNFVLNAIDAMPAGGISHANCERGETIRIEFVGHRQGTYPRGMLSPIHSVLHHEEQGTGLGLAIVQSVISDHHGTICVSSEENRGTTSTLNCRNIKLGSWRSNRCHPLKALPRALRRRQR